MILWNVLLIIAVAVAIGVAFSLGSYMDRADHPRLGAVRAHRVRLLPPHGNRPLRLLTFEQGTLASTAEMMHNRGTGERSAPNLFGPAPARVLVRQRGAHSRIRLLRAFGTPRASSLGGVPPVA